MEDITNEMGTFYHPQAALLIYSAESRGADTYVEYYDIDKNGCPFNAHPLTVREAQLLSDQLKTKTDNVQYLRFGSLIPDNVLFIDQIKGKVVWYSKPQKRNLLFAPSLGIPSGMAQVPALLWVADRKTISVFALAKGTKKPDLKTKLHHAPFFNVYEDGHVCLGTVDIDFTAVSSVVAFMERWENYFFNSYFSHLFSSHNPVNGNCVLLWQSLIGTNKPFPYDMLSPSNKTLKSLLP